MNLARSRLGRILLISALPTGAQAAEFLFDPNGNLAAQTADSSAPPTILSQPQSQVVRPGQPASFSVVAARTHTLTYQWLLRGTPAVALTNDSFTLVNPDLDHEGEYRVVLTNPSGSVTSAPALLWIDGDSDGMPDSLERARFGSLSATATGDFDGDGVSNEDEFREGTNPADASSFRPRLRLRSEPYGLGMVTTSPGGPPHFALGQIVTLTAAPLRHGSFLGWSGPVTGVKTQVALRITGHMTATARFGTPAPPVEPPVFVSVSPVAGGGGSFRFTWSTIPGRRYQVQVRTNLHEAAWANLGPPVTATDVITTLDEAIGANPRRFYRVGLLP